MPGKPAEAVAALQKALQVKPDWERGDEVLLALAQSLRLEKKPDEAAVQLKRLASTPIRKVPCGPMRSTSSARSPTIRRNTMRR